jgi:molybdate transport system substrate-binding protein
MIKRITGILPAGLLVLALLLSCPAKRGKETVTVSAAASLTEWVTESGRLWNAKNGRVELVYNFGSSSTLARQIEAGAPVDLFLSAHPKWTGYLQERDLLAGAPVTLLRNTLVVAVPGSATGEPMLLNRQMPPVLIFPGRIAMGDPEHVPAGIYGREALLWLGWWDAIEGSVLPCADVRAAMTALTTGEADCAIVYKTDLYGQENVSVQALFPAGSHEPILYTAGLTVSGAQKRPARDFLLFLQGPEAAAAAEKLGFDI